ncbi:hypothetical protein [Pseudobythopirellula maris]|nr:hypothetical protein [Pseudobythopirellula maris]
MRRTLAALLAATIFSVPHASAQLGDWGSAPNGRYGSSAAPSPPSANASVSAAATPSAATAESQMAPVGTNGPRRARVTEGNAHLPNDADQKWREYDIRPYTMRMGDAAKPQQAIVDWILRETGYDAWHSETFGLMNASRDTLTVYHTPEMQNIVADIVDRFVNSRSAERAFSMRVAAVRNPNWRAKALGLLTPIPVQSPGLQGWIMPKENYALLLSELQRRGDYREYNAANQVVPNGQSTVFSTMRPRGYVKGIVRTANAWPGFQPEPGQLEEGAALEFNPLLSLDLTSAEAVVKLRLNQIEKLVPVTLDLPSAMNTSQKMKIDVPQMTMANLHERFRWPSDQVLLLSMGVVATPTPDESGGNPLSAVLPMLKSPPRADALLFIEVKNSITPSAARGGVSTAARPGSFSGRY